LILQDIRLEKREVGTVLRSGRVKWLLQCVSMATLCYFCLFCLFLSHFLVSLVVAGSGAGGYTRFQLSWLVTPCHLSNSQHLKACSQNYEQIGIVMCLSLGLSVRKERLGSHWKVVRENWYLIIFKKSVQKIQVSVKCNKNNE
jgi:hypothetical protein